MAHLNKKCLCDETKYAYCPDCSRADALKPTWYSEFCSESCMTLWTTLTKFGMNLLTKAEAKEIISALELKPIDAYVACVQRDYAKVMAEEKKPRKIKKIEPIVEIAPIVEQLEEVAEPVVAEPIHEVILKENE
jgi:hypothetical protein